MCVNTIIEVATEVIKKATTEVSQFDATALYYTYSTIAQTLAAAFAFVGAFVLFRLQSIDKTCLELTNIILKYLTLYNPSTLHNLNIYASENNWKKWINNLKTFYDKGEFISLMCRPAFLAKDKKERKDEYKKWIKGGNREHYLNQLCSLSEKRDKLTNRFKRIAISSGITIIMSLVLLPFSSILCLHWAAFLIPLVLTIAATIYCLYGCVKTTLNATK